MSFLDYLEEKIKPGDAPDFKALGSTDDVPKQVKCKKCKKKFEKEQLTDGICKDCKKEKKDK